VSDKGRASTQPGGEALFVVVLGERTDDLAPRPERWCAPALPAATPEDTGLLPGRVRSKMLDEPGLADPRLPSNQKQPSPAIDRVFQAGHQFCHFPVPAYEGPRS
jgi:hypothetical protein